VSRQRSPGSPAPTPDGRKRHDRHGEPVVYAYTAEQAGQLLGNKGKQWMEDEARAGRIGYTKAGQTLLFMPEHLLAYLRANEVKPTSPLTSRPRRSGGAADVEVPALQARPPKTRTKGVA
jgi:hypothetical protein